MGLEFLKQYGAKRYVNDVEVYRDQIACLNTDLILETRKQSDLFFLTHELMMLPNNYESVFSISIVDAAAQSARKLTQSSLRIERIKAHLDLTRKYLNKMAA